MTSDNTEALKPCPFCKSRDLCEAMQDVWQKWLIGCRSCGAEGPQADTPAEAVTAWNTRAGTRYTPPTDAGEVDRLMHVIDRDRYIVAAVVGAIKRAINGRAWLLGEGRGPYEWDDERYKDEFRGAVEEIESAAEPLAHVGWDKTDCTQIEERVEAARLAAREFLNRPVPKRQMIAADIGLPCHACTALRHTPAPVENGREACDARVREIINQHSEYMNGFDRGQINFGREAVMTMLREALRSRPSPAPVAGEVERLRTMLVDDPNNTCAGIPDSAIEAGMVAWDKAQADLERYVSGVTRDWDEGMVVAAIFKAVARTALAEEGSNVAG